MSEKENRPTEKVEESPKTSHKTIDLVEWQRKNKAYLEKRAKEKAKRLQREAAREEQSHTGMTAIGGDEKESPSQQLVLDDKADNDSFDTDKKEVIATSPLEDEQEGDSQKSEHDHLTEETSAEGDSSVLEDATDSERLEEDSENESETDEVSEVPEQEESDEDESELLESSTKPQKRLFSPQEVKSKRRKTLKRRKFWRLSGLFAVGLVSMLVSAYLVSPWSKLKTVMVDGVNRISAETVLAGTGISQSDYTLTTILNQKNIEKTIEERLVWVKDASVTYHFPTDFHIQVKEHQIIGYVKDGNVYYPVLSSGDVLDAAVTADYLPPRFVYFQMTDLDMIKKFVVALSSLELTDYTNRIVSVQHTPSQASQDLLTIETIDGHSVLIPLSDVTNKIVYYERLLPTLFVPSYIDMEVGIFTYAK